MNSITTAERGGTRQRQRRPSPRQHHALRRESSTEISWRGQSFSQRNVHLIRQSSGATVLVQYFHHVSRRTESIVKPQVERQSVRIAGRQLLSSCFILAGEIRRRRSLAHRLTTGSE